MTRNWKHSTMWNWEIESDTETDTQMHPSAKAAARELSFLTIKASIASEVKILVLWSVSTAVLLQTTLQLPGDSMKKYRVLDL